MVIPGFPTLRQEVDRHGERFSDVGRESKAETKEK